MEFLQSHQQFSSPHSNQRLEYQSNVKAFIKNVEGEVSLLIKRYEQTIKQLKQENDMLRKQIRKESNQYPSVSFDENFASISPIKKGKGCGKLNFSQTNLFNMMPSKSVFTTEIKGGSLQKNGEREFGKEETYGKMGKSRFQMKSKMEKRKQQELIESLQMGRNNLNLNTTKMLNMLGHEVQTKNEENEQIELVSPKKKSKKQSLNTSLSSICESLDNSFHGKKAKAKKAKQQKQKEKINENQEEERRKQEKKRKEQGIKNLLQSLRQNINSSPQKPAQIIKGNKLLTTGTKEKVKLLSKSKVMINPVPVDINKQRQSRKRSTSPIHKKNPQSILKNASNFLSRSISNISAISFHSSGGDQ